MRPEVSIIIPAHNAAGTIGAQLAALAAQEGDRGLEVIVVDNRSTDATGAIVREYEDRVPDLRLLKADDGAGAAYARNEGVRAAGGRLLLFCDADDVVGANWVAAMVAGLADAEMVGGAIEVSRLNAPEVAAGYPDLAPGLQVGRHQMPFATGCSMGIRREVFERLGGFDAASSPAEDQDLSLRLQFAGLRLAFVPDAVVHYRLRPTLRGTARQYYHYGKSDSRLYRRFPEVGPALTLDGQVRSVLHHLLRAPKHARRMDRVRLVRNVSCDAGRLVGLILR